VAAQISSESTRRYLNDDDQDTGGVKENSGYRDGDDPMNFSSTHLADTADMRSVAATVQRYYSAARTGNARSACSMLVPELARAIPLDYGKLGPSYLRGAKTCQALVRRLYRHYRRELSAPIAVTGVLELGDHAFAFIGSPLARAGYLTLQREGSAWELATLISADVP
jgi:hypothetical protein